MIRRSNEILIVLREVTDRLTHLEHEAELFRNILIVKEPNTGHAAEAFDGLRKQILAAAAERRSHLAQLATLAVALRRATSLDDLRPRVREWMEQAGVTEVRTVPLGTQPQDLFDDAEGVGLAGGDDVEVLEPAYVDAQTGSLLRLGRARRALVTMAPPDETADAVGAPDDRQIGVEPIKEEQR